MKPSPPAFSASAWGASAQPRAPRLWRWDEFRRYFGASVVALGVDVACLAGLVAAGWPALPAAALGFLFGSVVAFVLSSVWAFEGHSYRRWHDGLAVFTAIGLLGLGVNLSVLWVGLHAWLVPLWLAKAVAALCSFSLNFALRKLALFNPPPAGRAE